MATDAELIAAHACYRKIRGDAWADYVRIVQPARRHRDAVVKAALDELRKVDPHAEP